MWREFFSFSSFSVNRYSILHIIMNTLRIPLYSLKSNGEGYHTPSPLGFSLNINLIVFIICSLNYFLNIFLLRLLNTTPVAPPPTTTTAPAIVAIIKGVLFTN